MNVAYADVLEIFEEASGLGCEFDPNLSLTSFSVLPQIDEQHLDEWMRNEAAAARSSLSRAIAERASVEHSRREQRSSWGHTPSLVRTWVPAAALTVEERKQRQRVHHARNKQREAKARADVRAIRAKVRLDPKYSVWDSAMASARASGAWGGYG
jgi:hypothetical protein